MNDSKIIFGLITKSGQILAVGTDEKKVKQQAIETEPVALFKSESDGSIITGTGFELLEFHYKKIREVLCSIGESGKGFFDCEIL
jgi:hypothetical protein